MDHIHTHNPDLYKPYIFFILLHEYLHTLGYHDEEACRIKTLEVVQDLFGSDDVIYAMAHNINAFLPEFSTMQYVWVPPQDPQIRYVHGFDRSSVTYII